MNRRYLSIFVAISFVTLAVSRAQSPQPSPADQDLLALVKEVQAQQAQIVANQAQIETKLAEITETIRVARLFAGKAGK